jgi:hypothetical protein
MRNKIIIFVLLFSVVVVLHGRATLTGYIALDYVKGLDDPALTKGSFQNVLAGLQFFGDISSGLTYSTELQFNPEGTFDLMQAWISLGATEGIGLKLGLYLVPFGRYNESNRPHQTALINPPLTVEKMYPWFWRDVGILLEGRIRGFFYSAYLGNGLAEGEDLTQGQQFKDNNPDKAGGGRLGFRFGRGFEVAYSHYRGKYDDDGTRDLVLQGVDIQWFTPDWQVLAEYSIADLDNPDGPGRAEGYFIQALMNLGKFRPVVSYQHLDYDDSFHGSGFTSPDIPGLGIDEKHRRWAVGLIFNVSQNLLLKFEYDWDTEKVADVEDESFAFQAAFRF